MIMSPDVRRSSRFTANEMFSRETKRSLVAPHCKPSGNRTPAVGSPRERDKNIAQLRVQATKQDRAGSGGGCPD
jgi:hypothetical protein